jgi:phosphatidylinositol glycan class U
MFKSYQTLSDPGLFLSMISLFPEIYERTFLSCYTSPSFTPHLLVDLNNPIVTALLHLHASLLLPLFNRLWLAQGTGNANFFYASTLVFGLANGFAVTDCLWAGLMTAVGKAQEHWAVVQVYDVDDKVKKGGEMENKTE